MMGRGSGGGGRKGGGFSEGSMQTVAFTDVGGTQRTASFSIFRDRQAYREASRASRGGSLNRGGVGTRFSDFKWGDSGAARVEKMAARQAGINSGEPFYYIQR